MGLPYEVRSWISDEVELLYASNFVLRLKSLDWENPSANTERRWPRCTGNVIPNCPRLVLVVVNGVTASRYAASLGDARKFTDIANVVESRTAMVAGLNRVPE